MTSFTAANYLSNAARTEAEMKQAFEDNLAATKQLPGAVAQSTLTIATDAITPTAGFHLVDTQAAAATDDLSTINQTNLPDGSFLWLGLANGTHNVVLKHNVGGAGKLSLVAGVDVTLDLTTSFVIFQRNGTVWEERGRFYGTDDAAHRAFYATAGFGVNTFTGRQEWDKGADIASGATLTLGTDGNYFDVTGTTGITAISSAPIGTRVLLQFDGALTITHNATSLILPAGANIQTSAGTTLEFVSEGSGNWRMISATLAESVQVLDRVTADTTVSNTAVETTIYTFSVPGGTLGTAKSLVLKLQLSVADNGGAAQSLAFKLKYGATTLTTLAYVTGIDNGGGIIRTIGATAWGVILTAILSGDGGTGAQVGTVGVQSPLKAMGEGASEAATDTNVVGGAASGGRGTSAEDSTAAKNLVVTAQWNSAAPQRILIMEHATLLRE